jgi:hypothetical protein
MSSKSKANLFKIQELEDIINLLKPEYKTKLDKCNIASYDSNAIISLKRISRNMRSFIYYSDFIDIYDQYGFDIINKINDFMINGLIIVLLNEDIFKVKENSSKINDFILNRIGSNENISVIILIKKCHNNTFINNEKINDIIERFNILKEKNNWKLLEKLKPNNCGNDKWKGHYAIDTRGGNQNGKREGEIQLANNINEYCSYEISFKIRYLLTFYMFHVKNAEEFLINKDKSLINIYKDKFNSYYQYKNIDKNIYKYIENDSLICPISFNILAFSDFESDKIQLCHLQPVSKCKIKLDDQYGILSSHNHFNVSWGFKNANMTQLDQTLEDTLDFNIDMTINILNQKLKKNINETDKYNITQALFYLNLAKNI